MEIKVIEDAILARLSAEITYLRTAETYAGDLEEDLGKMPINFPAVFVVYKGSELEWVDGPSHNDRCEFTIMAAAKDVRGQNSTRRKNDGCYQLIKDVLDCLTNQNFGLEMERLRPKRVTLVYISKAIAVYGIDFETNFDTAYAY